MRNKYQTNNGDRRGGFTLVEMLIVIAIIAILAAVTVTAIYATANSDRIRGAARQMQSAMQGAMAKAARAKKPIGVRLVRDPLDSTGTASQTISSMVFIEQLDDFEEGQIQFEEAPTGTGVLRYINHINAEPTWEELRNRGLLPDITRIKVTVAGTEQIYIVNTTETGTGDANPDQLILISSETFTTAAPSGRITPHASSPGLSTVLSEYKLEMGNGPLANQEPLEMPNGNVIDLSYSQVPAAWLEQQTVPDTTDPIPGGWVKVADLPASSEFIIQRQIDIMFSPQGVVTGPLAAAGKIHLMLAEIEDTLVNRAPELAEGENIITSIYTNTGNIAAAPVDKTNPPAYYNFAESGEVAGR
ncbi:hypothetical protein CA54_31080 [Symmachiella macrocystis]|uniref:Prepilin-type N-terminal cleavage/methylation domain-containing protein n=1 Tax=Symmachiella macrocystis TaxID=2527985 RepID=A0A5C6BQH1_9PLAN|nr:prepilin-type N-terminal cleavage/methylation domain-containing protein [Symmachiella macrocystis]TWU14265.1 hypothetical protein CA54_31080 [Symmachiella macrocystis]